MRDAVLSAEEARLWHAWKLAGETVMARVARDITEATKLSGADFGVLSRLADIGNGELRQHDLAEAMRWDKGRLSHQLTRMEGRGLITRRPADGKGITVGLTSAGKKALSAARPIHARSIRRHLLAKLSVEHKKTLLAICGLLQGIEEAE